MPNSFLIIYWVIVARLICGEPIIANELSVVTAGCFDGPIQIGSGEIHVENAEFLAEMRKTNEFVTR